MVVAKIRKILADMRECREINRQTRLAFPRQTRKERKVAEKNPPASFPIG